MSWNGVVRMFLFLSKGEWGHNSGIARGQGGDHLSMIKKLVSEKSPNLH